MHQMQSRIFFPKHSNKNIQMGQGYHFFQNNIREVEYKYLQKWQKGGKCRCREFWVALIRIYQHISAHVKIAIDETSQHVSERANCSLVSISPCLTTRCIIYIEVQSYFIWCWQLFLELWVKCRHERVSGSRVRLRLCEWVCPFLLSIHAHTPTQSSEYNNLSAAHFQVYRWTVH